MIIPTIDYLFAIVSCQGSAYLLLLWWCWVRIWVYCIQ